MRWRRRKRLRELEYQDRMFQAAEEMLQRHHRELERQVAILLLEALRPLAAALERQDSLLVEQSGRTREALVQTHAMLEEMLEEVLNSLQPSPRELIMGSPAPPKPRWLPPVSES
jgi:hypothetical protein